MIRIESGVFGVFALFMAATLALGQPTTHSSGLNPLKLSAHHVTASVADLNKEAAWYERVLGFQRSKLIGNSNDFSLYHMTIPGYRIDLASQKGSSRQHEAEGALEQGWLHIVFKTPDIDAAYKLLVAQGTDVKAYRDARSDIIRMSLHDPEGNELEIVRE